MIENVQVSVTLKVIVVEQLVLVLRRSLLSSRFRLQILILPAARFGSNIIGSIYTMYYYMIVMKLI